MVYENCKIYGPYTRSDGRKHVIVVASSAVKRTVSYPKYIVEMHINRYLVGDETVDHIDMDINNNHITNLQIINKCDHIRLDVRRFKAKIFVCPYCLLNFTLLGRKLNDAIQNRKKGKAGPFCSRSCSGKYSKDIQMGANPLTVIQIKPAYTTNKHLQSLHEEIHEVEPAKTGKP